MNFGIRLRELREEKELTQEELGKKLNLKKASISKYENEKLQPSIETINFLATFFNVSTDYLLGKTDIRETPEQRIEGIIAESQAIYKTSEQISPEDIVLLEKIKNLPDKDRKVVKIIIEHMERKDDKQSASGK